MRTCKSLLNSMFDDFKSRCMKPRWWIKRIPRTISTAIRHLCQSSSLSSAIAASRDVGSKDKKIDGAWVSSPRLTPRIWTIHGCRSWVRISPSFRNRLKDWCVKSLRSLRAYFSDSFLMTCLTLEIPPLPIRGPSMKSSKLINWSSGRPSERANMIFLRWLFSSVSLSIFERRDSIFESVGFSISFCAFDRISIISVKLFSIA